MASTAISAASHLPRASHLALKIMELQRRMAELERKNSELLYEKSDVERQLEETKKTAQVLSSQKEEAESSLQEYKNTAQMYQAELEKQIQQKIDELKMLEAKKAEIDMRAASLESELQIAVAKNGELEADIMAKNRECDLMKDENDKLRSEVLAIEQKYSLSEAEVNRLEIELGALKEEKEATAMAFDAKKEEFMKELEDLKRKLEEIQVSRDSMKEENEKLRSEVFTAEQKLSLSEAVVNSLQIELGALREAKEVAAMEFDAAKAEIIKESEDLKRKMEEVQAINDLMKIENDKLQSEVLTAEQKNNISEAEIKRLTMELAALEEAKEATVKTFDAERAEIMKQSEDLKRKMEEIQAINGLMKSENDMLRSEILSAEQKYNLCETEIKRLMMELYTLGEMKEADAKAFADEKAEIMKKSEDLKRMVEEIQASKDLIKDENDKLQTEVLTAQEKHSQLEAELERLKMELGASVEAKQEASKAFDAEKVKITKELEELKRKLEEIQASNDLMKSENDTLRSKVSSVEQKHSLSEAEVKRLMTELGALSKVKEVLENNNAEKDGEVEKLRTLLKEKDGKIDVLNKDIEMLRLAMTELQQKKKGSIQACLSSAGTCLHLCNSK